MKENNKGGRSENQGIGINECDQSDLLHTFFDQFTAINKICKAEKITPLYLLIFFLSNLI
jgi:hypothetical protein